MATMLKLYLDFDLIMIQWWITIEVRVSLFQPTWQFTLKLSG